MGEAELIRQARTAGIVWSCYYWENWEKGSFKKTVGKLREEQKGGRNV